MEQVYQQIGSSRQNVHQRLSRYRKKQLDEVYILDQVRQWRIAHNEMGSRTMYYSMQHAGINIPIGVTAFENLMSRHGLTIGKSKRSFPKTSDGKGKGDYMNLTNGLILNNINQLLSTDITYFWVGQQWYYLFVLKDVYSQHLLSLIPSQSMNGKYAIDLLKDVEKVRQRSDLEGCILHSDNGSQFNSRAFLSKLKDLKMRISRAGSCEENGSCEQMNHMIKNMYLRHLGIKTFKELQSACRKVKRLMNEQRAVKQLGYRTVIEFEEYILNLKEEERPKKELYDFSKKS